MRVFLAGGSGAIGRVLVPRLVAAGHEVAATTGSPAKASLLESFGATATVLDALDEEAVRAAVKKFRPNALMNQLTSLPKRYNPRRLKPWYEATSRLRVEGTRILLRAAAEVGADRFVYQSIAFMYAIAGPLVVDEKAPLALEAPEPFGPTFRATLEGERLATSVEGIEGVVLRYGQLYGPGTYFAADGDFARQARMRLLPILGGGGGIFSFLHVNDAATSALAALEHGSGVYNITDDDPAPGREWIPAFCAELGAPRPLRLPAWLARIPAGGFATALLTDGRGASNAKAKRELGWSPSRATWRAGFLAAQPPRLGSASHR
ncbi:MAG: NAD(P)-dependent oxidoreductase [Candidatus Dormibacteraeota bacterium]|nr:NAD(P)-dependent oxidoreductase [Candidatus Dormibacteraeota bacterium]